MRKQTWLNFKSKAWENKWENKKKIRSLNQTICNNINCANKEKFDMKTDIDNMKYEMDAICDAHPESSKIFEKLQEEIEDLTQQKNNLIKTI